MSETILLRKLIAIDQAIGSASNNALRELVYDAETYLLEMQRDRAKPVLPDRRHAAPQRILSLREIPQERISALGRQRIPA